VTRICFGPWLCKKRHGGPGGTVEKIKDIQILESDYYPDAAAGISNFYQHKLGYRVEDTFVGSTANVTVSGRWSRPDITLVCVKRYTHIHQRRWDLVTFELKRPEDINVLSVFEALSHRSAATLSYVILPISSKDFNRHPASSRIMEECQRHGIGILVSKDICDVAALRELVAPAYIEPKPERIDEFVSLLPREFDQKMREWHL
jgi:hypothetical protein